MALEVHREPLYRRYYASYTSFACVWTVACAFFVLFIPIIISYNSGNFWLKERIAYEQPDIAYRYKALFQFYGTDTSDATSQPFALFYSTSIDLNNLFSDKLRMSIIRTAEIDQNSDGLMDRLELGIQVPLSSTEQITGFTGLLYHTCVLKERAKYSFDGVSYISHESGFPLGQLDIDGDLMIRQSMSLSMKGGYKLPYENDPLLSIEDRMSASDADIKSIMRKTAARNLTTVFTPQYSYAVPMIQPTAANSEMPKFFNATINVRIPIQPLLYTPNASEVLKFAFVQFAAFFIVVYFLFNRLTSFVFRHRLIYGRAEADVEHEKSD